MRKRIDKKKFDLVKEYRRFQRRHAACPPGHEHTPKTAYKRKKLKAKDYDTSEE